MAAARRFIASAQADTSHHHRAPIATAWQYGWGEYDEAAHRVKTFQPLPHFTGKAWQGAAQWPNENLGWAQLTAKAGIRETTCSTPSFAAGTRRAMALSRIAGEIVHEARRGRWRARVHRGKPGTAN
jgi:hypothetical protein